jgi:hypothetical protein
MKKFTMLFVLALFLKIAVGQVTVTITVKNNLSPITTVSGASVTLTGATTPTVISDASGLAVFTVPSPAVAGYFNIAITAAGYLDYSSSALVYIKPTDVTLAKTATIKKAFDITYKITDKNSVAISGASVKINTAPITTQTTDANGDVTFLGLYSVATHSTLVTASGYADSTFNVTIAGNSPNPFVVPAVKLRNAYNITFTVSDGTNPVAGANVTIGTTTATTDANGLAAFTKKVNGTYAYSITKTGIVDKFGTVTVTDADANPAVTVNAGYDLVFTIINGASGTTGLQKDTITIDGTTRITGTTGILTFGVAAGSSYSFDNKKAGFITVPVSITNIQANTALTINMVPVYSIKFTVQDSYTNAKILGAKVTLNGTDILTDVTGVAKFTNVAPSATALPYTITGPDGSTYITQTGTIQAPLTSTSYLSNNNNISKSIYIDRPYVFIGLTSGMMSYYGAATITFNGVDYPYDAGLAGNTFFVAPGTYSYTITPADVTKAIITGSVTLTSTASQNLYINVVDGKKIEMYVVDATPDKNTIDGASVTLDGVAQITDASGYVVYNRKAVNTSYPYAISKTGYGTVTGTAALVTADLTITTVLHTAYKVTAKVYDNTTWSEVPVGLAGATVLFNGTSVVTDANGVAILPDAVNGSYDYTISIAGFLTVKGTAVVKDADLTFETYLKPAFSVQFTVTDGTNPVANASIRLVSSWPVFDQTFVTNAQGVLLTDMVFPKYTSLVYTISAPGFADSTGTVNIQSTDLVVDPIALKRAYQITFTVNDGTNPVSDAAVTINNVLVATNASGVAVFPKMINGNYSYLVSKSGFVDMPGTVTVTDANTAKTVSLAAGYNVTFTVINGPTGTVGLANDTITINGITKVTDATGIVVFGVAPNTAISFVNNKAGFVSVPVDIASVTSDMAHTIYMVPVYNVVFRAVDNFSTNPIPGATVIFNGITVNTDMDGYAYFKNIAPSADPYAYSVSGNGSYTTKTGEVILPFTSTEGLLMNNNIVNVPAELSSPGVYMVINSGMIPYFGQATITLDGIDYQYDPGFGAAIINCSLGTHNYVVTPQDITKAIARGSVTVTSTVDKEFVEVQIKAARKIEIYAINPASDPIEGASVTLSGNTIVTDNTGLALFDRYSAGSYTYTITKEGYKSVEATSLDVNTTDVQKIVTMEPLVYNITFNVTSGIEILEGAVVTIDGVSVNTDASGKAVFAAMPAGTYSYTVTKAGTYKDASGSIIVTNADVTENVDLINTTGIGEVSAKTVKLYPNPTSGILNINLPVNNGTEATIRVTNILGSVILENKVVNGLSQVKLDVSGFENGIYFVTVKGSGYENTIKVVKK